MRAGAALAAMALVAATACGKVHLEPEPARCQGAACGCAPERTNGAGVCCAVWTRPAGDRCEAVTRRSPPSFRNLGPLGAQGLMASVDGRGKILLGWLTADATTQRAVVAEEQPDGSFRLREPAQALEGRPAEIQVAGGPDGRATVALWQTFGEQSSAIFVSERANDGAWRDPTKRADAFSFPPHSTDARVLTTPTGEVLVAWDQWVDASYGVQVARRTSTESAWERPAGPTDTLSVRTLFTNSPRIAATPEGDAMISWFQAVRGGTLPNGYLMAFVAERKGREGAFSRSTGEDHLSVYGADVSPSRRGAPVVAMARSGDAACAWAQGNLRGHVVPFLARKPRGGEWQKPASLDDSLGRRNGYVDRVEVAYAAGGTLYLVWTQNAGDGMAVYGLRVAADGTFIDPPQDPVRLSPTGASPKDLALATGRDGAVAIAWSEATGIGSAIRLRRAVERAEDAGWGSLETISFSESRGEFPALAFGGTPERLVVAWAEDPGGGGRVQVATYE